MHFDLPSPHSSQCPHHDSLPPKFFYPDQQQDCCSQGETTTEDTKSNRLQPPQKRPQCHPSLSIGAKPKAHVQQEANVTRWRHGRHQSLNLVLVHWCPCSTCVCTVLTLFLGHRGFSSGNFNKRELWWLKAAEQSKEREGVSESWSICHISAREAGSQWRGSRRTDTKLGSCVTLKWAWRFHTVFRTSTGTVGCSMRVEMIKHQESDTSVGNPVTSVKISETSLSFSFSSSTP